MLFVFIIQRHRQSTGKLEDAEKTEVPGDVIDAEWSNVQCAEVEIVQGLFLMFITYIELVLNCEQTAIDQQAKLCWLLCSRSRQGSRKQALSSCINKMCYRIHPLESS